MKSKYKVLNLLLPHYSQSPSSQLLPHVPNIASLFTARISITRLGQYLFLLDHTKPNIYINHYMNEKGKKYFWNIFTDHNIYL